MSTLWFGCVVEGEAEVAALPALIRRIASSVVPGAVIQVPRPVLLRRTRIAEQFGDLARAIERALGYIQHPDAVFVLLDADEDEDCPARLGPALLQRATAVRSDVPLAVVLAKREYEAWFLAAAESLRGKRGLPDDLEAPLNPEEIRGAKDWLRKHTPRNRKYSPKQDQPALTALFDLELARSRSSSFDKCYREIVRLLSLLQQAEPAQPPAPEPKIE